MQKRVLIVDYNHMIYNYLFGGTPALSHTVVLNGKPQTINTTLQTFTIKAIHRWSNFGQFPTAVCFDSPCRCRRKYFEEAKIRTGGELEPVAYKAGRATLKGEVYESINMTLQLLHSAGVCVYKAANFEADDLVYACVQKAKQQYPDLPIDIICNDADLLPLVDNQVSVFLRSRVKTWAESKELEKPHYIQVTPYNYQEVVEGLTDYKKLAVPYNSILLTKLLRGDKSDSVPAMASWKPKQYKQLVTLLQENGEDIAGMFRYGGDEQLNYMLSILSKYIEEEDLNHIRYVYNGINLNSAFRDLPEGYNREPAVIQTNITPYSEGELQSKVSVLNIQLPTRK